MTIIFQENNQELEKMQSENAPSTYLWELYEYVVQINDIIVPELHETVT